MIEKGANIDVQNNCGDTPLHNAIRRRLEDISKFLIEKGANLDIQDVKYRNTPLNLSIRFNFDENIVRFLIEKGANIDVQNNRGYTPLYKAIKYKLDNISKFLIEKVANIKF